MVANTTLLAVLFFLPLAWAQFPAVCNTQDSLSNKTCCPGNCGAHGTCVSIREEVERSWESANASVVEALRGMQGYPQDVRYQWPLKIFERVCSCDEGWGGYACSHCDFGFIANKLGDCVKRSTDQLLVRRNFLDITEQERLNLVTLILASKNEEEKEWSVMYSMPDETNDFYGLQNVSTYDMMIAVHLHSAKEKESGYCPPILFPDAIDKGVALILFAHQNTPFLPWHRYLVLQYERELRRIGEKIGIHNFTLPYWDWSPASNCLMFTRELFGTPEYSEDRVNVSGAMFENGKWPVVLDIPYRVRSEVGKVRGDSSGCIAEKTLGDVDGDRMDNRPLQRGAWRDDMRGLRLPDYKLISMTLTSDQFEGIYGFANRLEGHLEQCSGESVKCMYSAGGGLNTHALVHEFVGGHFSIGATAVNDPVFFPHHANVDRIFERWLQKYNGTPPSYQPVTGGPPGHNLNDFLVPMFPVKKIADIYKQSKELGYIYDVLPWDIPTTDYQLGCSNECDKGGYQPTILVNATSAYCSKIQKGHMQKSNGGP